MMMIVVKQTPVTATKMNKFDKLLHAMTTKSPLGKPVKADQTSSEARGEDCAGTQSPKDSSASASLTPKCASPE